jgi:hypothetical protein
MTLLLVMLIEFPLQGFGESRVYELLGHSGRD